MKEISTIPKTELEISSGGQKVLCMPSEPLIPAGKLPPYAPCKSNHQCASEQCDFFPPGAEVQQCNSANPVGCVCAPINPFSGGIFVRTDCQANGTNCQTGDCGNAPYQPCPLGKGAGNPASQAEFTLGEYTQDYYDVTLINGANSAIEMVPSSTPAPVPTSESTPEADYWCKTPGSPATQGSLPACPWDFKTTNVSSADWTALLTQISLPVCKPGKISCPLGSSCQPNGSGTYYCAPYQDSSGTCTKSSDCSTGWSCFSGLCLPYGQCSTYQDCPLGSACVNGLCDNVGCSTTSDCTSTPNLQSPTCLTETIRTNTGPKSAKVCVPMTCNSSVSCPAGFSCDSGTCAPTQASCSLSNPCAANQSCDLNSGECVTNFHCAKDGSCPLNDTCSEDMCVKGGPACKYSSSNDAVCPDGTKCPSSGECPGFCTSDADCASVDGICNEQDGACEPLTWDASTSCPSGYTEGASGQCVIGCGPSNDCADSLFGSVCGSGLYNADLLQTCGASTGAVWTMDDFCGLTGTGTYGSVDCEDIPTGASDTYAHMFKCTAGYATSCYNSAAETSTTCCGCPTSPSNDSSSWPVPWNDTVPSMTCYGNSTSWTNDIVPWLQYIKSACPTAYSFPFDDATSTFQCESNGTDLSSAVPNAMNYDIVFSALGINATPSPAPTP